LYKRRQRAEQPLNFGYVAAFFRGIESERRLAIADGGS
jgi:hypothetical protein